MAGKGGYQPPKKPAAVSGTGKNSKRTDGGPSQPMRAPDLDDPGQQYGEQKAQLEAQRAIPLPKVAPPQSGPAPRRSSPSSPAGAGRGLPPFLFEMDSNRPGEAVTAGLDMGPGPGSEVLTPPPPQEPYEQVLDYFAQKWNLKGAHEAIAAKRRASQNVVDGAQGLSRPAPGLRPTTSPTPGGAEAPVEVTPDIDDSGDLDDFLGATGGDDLPSEQVPLAADTGGV